MIRDARFHRRGDSQRLVDAAEIVIHEPDRHSSRVALDLLRECICQASEAANAHPHRKILPLNKTSAHMFGVRVRAHHFHVTGDAPGRRIARFLFGGCPVNLLQLRIVDVGTKAFSTASSWHRDYPLKNQSAWATHSPQQLSCTTTQPIHPGQKQSTGRIHPLLVASQPSPCPLVRWVCRWDYRSAFPRASLCAVRP